MGRRYADADARSYQDLKPVLRGAVLDALADLRARYDVVVCEGAGSPAEINLRAGDLANMGLARAADIPVVLVGDIDRGGVFASLYGSLALLEPDDQALVAGFVINKFRGDDTILAPGLEQLLALTGRPTLGVLPWLDGVWLDAEDSLALEAPRPEAAAARGGDTLEVAVIRLRWMSNFTDVDALTAEPGVSVRFTRSPADVERADLVLVPGTKATVEDLERLRAGGLDAALARRAAAGDPILGVCGGYQMLGEAIEDEVESRRGDGGRPRAAARPHALRARQAAAPRGRDGRAGRRGARHRLRDPPRGAVAPRRRGDDRRRQRGGRGLCGRRRARHLVARPARGRRGPPRPARRGWRRAAAGGGWRAPSPSRRSASATSTASARSSPSTSTSGALEAMIEGGAPAGLPVVEIGAGWSRPVTSSSAALRGASRAGTRGKECGRARPPAVAFREARPAWVVLRASDQDGAAPSRRPEPARAAAAHPPSMPWPRGARAPRMPTAGDSRPAPSTAHHARASTVRDSGATSKRQNAWAGASSAHTSAARMTPACVTAIVREPSPEWASSQPRTRSSSASSDSPPCGAAAGSSIQAATATGSSRGARPACARASAPKSHSSSSARDRRVEPERLGGLARAGRRAASRRRRRGPGAGRARGPRRARGESSGSSSGKAERRVASDGAWRIRVRRVVEAAICGVCRIGAGKAPTRSIGCPQSARRCEEAGVKPARSRHCDRSIELRKPGDSPVANTAGGDAQSPGGPVCTMQSTRSRR